MSRLIKILPDDRHVYEGNLCVIRNDLHDLLWEQVFNEENEDFENYSRGDFGQNLEDCRSSILRAKKYSSQLEHLEDIALYSGIFLPGSKVLGLIFRLTSITAKEGGDLKLEVFERSRFGARDNPNIKETYYRDLYNQSLLKSSFMSSIIALSFLREISPSIYELVLDGLEKQSKGESRMEVASYVISRVNR